MKVKNCLIFGGSGQIGSHLIRKLTKNNYKVTVVTRNIHQKSYKIKTQANAGYIEIVESSIFDEKKIRKLFENTDICINLVGILYESRRGNNFKNIHTVFPSLLAKMCKEYDLDKFIHISALGINEAVDSNYAQSKLNGEMNILKHFPKANILRPSIVYSVDDNFTTNFMTLLNRLPFMPLYYDGKTKFSPIHVSDLVNILYEVINGNFYKLTLECIGPEILSFKEIINKLLKSINKKRILFPLPYPLAKISAKILQLLPNPLLTEDQLNLLKYDNVDSGLYKTNIDLGLKAEKIFDVELEKYSYNWRTGGQFASKNNLEKLK